jgi:cytoskeleton protein RodZ
VLAPNFSGLRAVLYPWPWMTKLTQMTLDNDGGGEDGGPNRRRIHLREISGENESPLQTVGQDLRAARLRRGDEIAQVSRALKIRKDHLDALEEDRLEDLPGKTYAIGFVRSYARHLGLDANAYVDRFKRDISGRTEDKVHEPAPIHQDEGRRLPQGWRIITGAVVILLGWGAWHLLSSGTSSNQPVPPAPVLTPSKPAAAPKPAPAAPVQAATPSPAASAAPPVATMPAGQEASATPPPAAGAKTPATSLPPSNTASSASPTAAPASQAAGPAVSTANGAGQVYGAMNLNPRVILRARADVRVTVKNAEGQMILNRELKSGDSYQVPNMPGISMATNNAGAVEMDLDGIALGRAGQPEQVIGRVSLDPQALTDRFNNH